MSVAVRLVRGQRRQEQYYDIPAIMNQILYWVLIALDLVFKEIDFYIYQINRLLISSLQIQSK